MNGHAGQWFNCIWLTPIFIFTASRPFSLGIENLSDEFLQSLRTKENVSYRVGLISNQTGRDQKGNRTVDILQKNGVRISYIMAPEHGFDGKAPAGKPIANSVDRKTGITIVSVYGRGGDQTISGKRIDPAIIKQLDVLCYDVQDSGMRHYTYISTLLCAMEAAAEHKKPIIIFDRPNMLGPNMEGPLVEPQLHSFISIASIPLRHGMTIGELARYFNKHVLKKPAELRVVKMQGYVRSQQSPFLAQLSPNLSSLQSLYGYSFLGILGEVKPLYIGVGTSHAFRTILLPRLQKFPENEWSKLQAILQKHDIHASNFVFNHKRQSYSGLKLNISDISKVFSFQLILELLQFFKQAGITLSYSSTFDKAVGTQQVKRWCAGSCSSEQIVYKVNADLESFLRKACDSLLYEPAPQLRLLRL